MARLSFFQAFIQLIAIISCSEFQNENTNFIAHASDATDDNFYLACSGGDVGFVQKALKETPSLAKSKTSDGETCLHLSAISGNVEIAKMLLENGADPNARTTSENGLRMHPLSWNVYGGHHEIVRLLLKHGANLNDDIDSMYDQGGKITVLDLAEQLLDAWKEEPDGGPTPIQLTYDIIVANGGKKYQDLMQEL